MPAELLRDTEIDADRLGVADVQPSVRLRRETRDDPTAVLPRQPVLGNDVANEVTGRRLRAAFWRWGWTSAVNSRIWENGWPMRAKASGRAKALRHRAVPIALFGNGRRGRGGRDTAAPGDGARYGKPPRRPVGADGAVSRLQRWWLRLLHQLQHPQAVELRRGPRASFVFPLAVRRSTGTGRGARRRVLAA